MEVKKIKREFKKGICMEDNRRRREESSIRLRKNSKNDGVAKRRNVSSTVFVQEDEQNEVGNAGELVSDLLLSLSSSNSLEQTQSLRALRRLLSAEKNPPVKQCIEKGLVQILVKFLTENNLEQQFEAAWALTNIASTDQTRYVVECQAVAPLVALLLSPSADIREQSAWCLGNIAGDGPELRDYILSHNALEPLLMNITQPASASVLRNCTWTLSNFCRGKPLPDLMKVVVAFPVLRQLIKEEVDIEALVDAAWAISYLSDGDDSRIQKVLDLGILPNMIKMIASNNVNMIIPALRTIGNIVSGTDGQTQAVVEAGALPVLASLLLNSKKSIRKEACWVLSNIAAGTPSQLNHLFTIPNLISRVVGQLNSATEWDVRKEAAWVVCNICTSCTSSKLVHLIELGVIAPMCDLLNTGDSRIILIALDALESILKLNARMQNINQLIEEAGGVELLEKLQEHENTKVYERTIQILERYFAVEEEENEENLRPNAVENSFPFGSFNNKSVTSGVQPSPSCQRVINFNF